MAQTVTERHDIRDFLDYFKASKDYEIQDSTGQVVGQIARWVRTTEGASLVKVKRKDGSRSILAGGKPVMIMTDLPSNTGVSGVHPPHPDDRPIAIDYAYYIEAATTLIQAIENPQIRRRNTIGLTGLSREQFALFTQNYATQEADCQRVDAFDLKPMLAKYAQAGRQRFDLMSRLLSWIWMEGRGSLTRGDLMALAWKLDQGTDYFQPAAKARALRDKVDWVAREISPFPATPTISDIAEEALLWAARTVKVAAAPVRIKKLLGQATLHAFRKTGNLAMLATKLAARAVRNKHPLSAADLANILHEVAGTCVQNAPGTCDTTPLRLILAQQDAAWTERIAAQGERALANWTPPPPNPPGNWPGEAEPPS